MKYMKYREFRETCKFLEGRAFGSLSTDCKRSYILPIL